jgi:hypothetical protein
LDCNELLVKLITQFLETKMTLRHKTTFVMRVVGSKPLAG